MTKAFKFKASQRFLIFIGEVSFYTTAKQIRFGTGGFTRCNAATEQCLVELERIKSGAGIAEQCTSGLAATFNGIQVQLSEV